MTEPIINQRIPMTKLTPPRLPAVLNRQRLLSDLERAKEARLTTVVAGPGYGKSTLAVQFLKERAGDFIWYQLEPSDRDLSVFLSCIIAGFRSSNPGFGRRSLEQIAASEDLAGESKVILSTLVAELDEMTAGDFYLVLDDFHVVNDTGLITESIDFILGHVLPNVHFMVLSRSSPALELSNLRVRSELVELSDEDLSFTRDETADLFGEVLGMKLNRDDVAALSDLAEGRAYGLVLFYLGNKGKSMAEIESAVRNPALSQSTKFDHLWKAAFKNQSEAVRDFAMRTSILSRMNASVCDELLDATGSSRILAQLLDNRLFTIQMDDRAEWYRYHHVFKTFLERSLEECHTSREIDKLDIKAAEIWERMGQPEEALKHYENARSHNSAARILDEIYPELVREKRTSFLSQRLSPIPREVLEEHPGLFLQKARIAAMSGDYGSAAEIAEAAGNSFGKAGDKDQEAQSLLFSASYCFSMAEPDQAERLLSRARRSVPDESPCRSEVLALKSVMTAGAGEDDLATKLTKEALGLTGETDAGRSRARILNGCGLAAFLQGRFPRALEMFSSADSILETFGPCATRAFTLALASRCCTYIGRAREAGEIAQKGIGLGEEFDLVPMIRLCRAAGAVASAYLGDHDTALGDASSIASLHGERRAIGEVWYSEWFAGEALCLIGEEKAGLEYLDIFAQMAGRLPWVSDVMKLTTAAFSLQRAGFGRTTNEVKAVVETLEKRNAGLVTSLGTAMLFRLKATEGRQDDARAVLARYVADFGPDVVLQPFTTGTDYLVPSLVELIEEGCRVELTDRLNVLPPADLARALERLEKSTRPELRRSAHRLAQESERVR